MLSKKEFLKVSFDHKAYGYKEWLIAVFGIGFEDPENKEILEQVPYTPWIEGGKYHFKDSEGKIEQLEGKVDEPIFMLDEEIDLEADFHAFLAGKAIHTTVGIFLFNVVMLYEATGDLIPYINEEFTKGLLMSHIEKIMCDEIPGQPIPEGKAGIQKCLQISKNCNYLEGILSVVVKCGSHDALTVSKEVLALKDKLIKENKDKLNDPVVFNGIVEQLVALDTEIQKKGKSNTFYISKDYISNCRKRMFMVFGIEYNAETDTWIPMLDPLTKGWDPKLMVDYINTAIDGAYNRGKATGEGGARVKEVLRIIASASRSEENCGSWFGLPITIFKANAKNRLGTYIIDGEQIVLLDKANIDKYIGKNVLARSPEFCLTENGNYCKYCLGNGMGSTETRLAADTSKVATVMMLGRMKQSHISGSSNSQIDLDQAFR